MFQDPQTRQMNLPKLFRKKKIPSDELFFHFSAKVQNLAVFSFVYMIRIRFFGPGELIQNYFRAAQYHANSHKSSTRTRTTKFVHSEERESTAKTIR